MMGHDRSERTEVYVIVQDDHLRAIDEVARALRAAGLEVHQVLPAVGAVTGLIEPGLLDDLRGVTGVESINVSRPYSPSHASGS